MTNFSLVLYSRKGCCLCEGLEEKLKSLTLHDFDPPLDLNVVDIDNIDTPLNIKNLYDNEVPVLELCLGLNDSRNCIVLPRVAPRLKEEGLSRWLKAQFKNAFHRIGKHL